VIVIEQVVSHIWDQEIIQKSENGGSSKLRRDQLRDNRTWTAAVKLEMLHQKGILSADALAELSLARKARNDLAHEGHTPSEASAVAALGGVQRLIGVVMPQKIPLFDLDLSDHSVSDPFAPPRQLEAEPEYWMAIPKLPGEEELEKLEASIPRQIRSDERRS
jgi:hypothetical protein